MNFRKFLVAGALSCSLTFSGLAVTNQAFAVEFADTSGFATEASINKLVSLGVMKNPGTMFNPDAALSRTEFAYMVNQVMALSAGKKITFKDLTSKHGDYTNTLKLVNNGYLALDKGSVKPTKGVTYAEMSKVLAQGLGLKKSWTNRPIDFLFYLSNKEVLDIDTNLDAMVTREDAAVAFDKYITEKGTFKTVKGIVVAVSDKDFTLNIGSENKKFTHASNVSVFVSGQGASTADVQVGSPATLFLNKKGQVAYYGGELLDAENTTIKLNSPKWTIGTMTKDVNLDAFVAPIPNRPNEEFSIKEIDVYSKAGAQFSGQVFFPNTDEVTAIYPYISKVENKEFTISGNTLTIALSSTITEKFNISEEVKVMIDEKEAKLADLGAKIKATFEADQNGNVVAITVTTPKETPKETTEPKK